MNIWLWRTEEWDPGSGDGFRYCCADPRTGTDGALFASREEAEAHFRKWLGNADSASRAISGEEITYMSGIWHLTVEFYSITV
jgi:hypothetical protein